MPDNVAMRTASRELGLRPKVLELAVQVGEIRSVRGVSAGQRRVPRTELTRLKESAGFPQSFEERLQVVDAADGAELLGIGAARFARLARGGCFSPVRFYVNRHRTVVWLYLARELRAFAERRPELLSGNIPRGLRVLLEEGVDFRPRHWRGRRVGQLCRQADGPWELAAARAAVLDAEALEEAVPDPGERARLTALKPELTAVSGESAATRDVAEEVCVAEAEDEILWHRLMLEADLEDARASRPPAEDAGAPPIEAREGAGVSGVSGAADAAESAEAVVAPRLGPGVPDVPAPAVPAAGIPAPDVPASAVSRTASGAVSDGDAASGGRRVPREVRQQEQGPCSSAVDPAVLRRRAHVLSRLRRGPHRLPGWWRREGPLRRPAL